MTEYATVASIVRDVAQVLRPPIRMTVPEAATKYVQLDIPGGYSGAWSNDLTDYLVEPAECLTSREYEAVIFVGPAQSAKTQALIDNWVAHTVICDPVDMMVVTPTQEFARDFSKRRIDRMISATPALKNKIAEGNGDNVFDKMFLSGILLNISWPTKNNLSGRPIPRMALTDYDRMPDDVDGEGPAFYLARKRTTTFQSRGMTLVESSPSKPVTDPKWRPKTLHEAPPTNGILGLYNSGDRRRIYAKCPHCGEYFMPSAYIDAIFIPDEGSVDERAAGAAMICQANGCLIGYDKEREFRKSRKWVIEGQTLRSDGVYEGRPIHSKRASFWTPGWFIAFQSWMSIILTYLSAEEHYNRTGDEEPLKAVVNTDMAAPYLYKAQQADMRDGSFLEERAEPIERYSAAAGVRTLLASVDIQLKSFEVMILGIGVGGEKWVVDRFSIRSVSPAASIEDWGQITDRVVKSTYRLEDGRELRVHMTAVDSGGKAGVTERAYEWWRELKRHGLGRRVRLVKGASSKTAARVKESFPDATGNRQIKSGGRGDVPVLIINTNQLKDGVYADLQRDTEGSGYVHFPEWLPTAFYDELMAEQRGDGAWKKIGGRRNESFDLFVYIRALWVFLKGDRIQWDRPPSWAADMEINTNVMTSEERRDMKLKRPAQKTGRGVRFRFNG